MPWLIVGGIVVIIVIWFIATYNRFVQLAIRVKEAFSTIDVFLKKRYDLIPNIVATVKGYAAHEKGTLDAVITARSRAINAAPEQRMESEAALTQALGRLMVLTENYPQLKADTQFMNLQQSLTSIESEIEKSRRYYNGVVSQFNTGIRQIPASIVAGIGNFKEQPFFEIEETTQREAVKVSF